MSRMDSMLRDLHLQGAFALSSWTLQKVWTCMTGRGGGLTQVSDE
jgi:hypothetical protein